MLNLKIQVAIETAFHQNNIALAMDLIEAYGNSRYEEGYNDGERSAKEFPRGEGS